MIEKLTPFVYSEGDDWRFTLDQTMSIRFTDAWFGQHQFHDDKGILRVELLDRVVTIYAGYSWDGSSPKFKIAGKWVGTPDFEGTRLASMYHDGFYQFNHLPCHPLTRTQCDKKFGEIMKAEKFPLWWVYCGAVLGFGGVHRGFGTVFRGGVRPGFCALHKK